jgi:hypothetical protein
LKILDGWYQGLEMKEGGRGVVRVDVKKGDRQGYFDLLLGRELLKWSY